MAKVELTISVKDDHLSRFSEVVDGIKKAGFEVDQELKSLGVVTGKMEAEKIHDLETMNGVAHIEQSRDIRIPSPHSDIQ